MTADRLGLRPCFADLDALVPRVTELGVTSTSAVSEPRTAATATTAFTRFRDSDTFGTYGTDGRHRRRRCRGCWYSKKQTEKRLKAIA